MTLAFLLILWESCYVAHNGKDWVCVSKPPPGAQHG